VRGFRGSRAAQSFNRGFDRHYSRAQKESYLRLVEQRAQPKAPAELPSWLRGLAEGQAKQTPDPKIASKPVAVAKPVAAAKTVAVAKSIARIAPAKKSGPAKKSSAKAKAPSRKAA